MALPVYMYEDNYQGRPWSKKSSVPQTHSRRISFDSFMERPRMHSRTPSMSSSVSSLSSSRNRLQKKTKHNSTPPSWSLSSSPSNKPLPSLPIWHSQYDVTSVEEYERRMARAAQAKSEIARRERQAHEQWERTAVWDDGEVPRHYAPPPVPPSPQNTRPQMPDFGDSWVMERPRRRGTYSTKKGWRFYCEAFTNFRNRNKST